MPPWPAPSTRKKIQRDPERLPEVERQTLSYWKQGIKAKEAVGLAGLPPGPGVRLPQARHPTPHGRFPCVKRKGRRWTLFEGIFLKPNVIYNFIATLPSFRHNYITSYSHTPRKLILAKKTVVLTELDAPILPANSPCQAICKNFFLFSFHFFSFLKARFEPRFFVVWIVAPTGCMNRRHPAARFGLQLCCNFFGKLTHPLNELYINPPYPKIKQKGRNAQSKHKAGNRAGLSTRSR